MGALQWLSIFASASAALAFTPEQLISAPRRGEAIPNPSGEIAVFSSAQYSFDTHKTNPSWNLLDLKTGRTSLLTNDSSISEIVWLGSDNSSIVYVNTTNGNIPGGVELWVSDISNFEDRYQAASLPAPFSGLKAAPTESGDINFLLHAQSYANGTAYNDKLVTAPLSSARIYDSTYVRHWNTYLTTRFNAVFAGTLRKSDKHRFTSSGELNNLVFSIKNAECPNPPFGGPSDYTISPDGKWVAFNSKAPQLPQANFTASYIYLVPHDGSAKPIAINGPESVGKPEGTDGGSASPAFSPDSGKLVYLQMDSPTYEVDRSKVYVYTIGSNETILSLAKNWDRSPASVKWAPDGESLVVASEDDARVRLFSIPANAGDDYKPQNFTDGGSAMAYEFLPGSTVLVTGSALWSSWNVYTASPDDGVIKTLFLANEVDPELKGLSEADIDEFHYEGDWTEIQSWLIYPEGFDKNKSYPLLLLLHGGPEGAWDDAWSTRWSPKVFADQGYVVVAPNPTGSTGFGSELQDTVQTNWGGAPYKDLVKCWEYVHRHFDFIDTDRGVAVGASFGGFMINWIQGSDLGRKFKALVCHDGVFMADDLAATDEIGFMQHEFNGTFWGNREGWRHWDPSAPERIAQFSTPQLVIHSDLDYRLPISQGIALFNVLQERGVPSRFLNFPDEYHFVVKPENSLVWHQQVLGWVNGYSGVGEKNSHAISLHDTVIPVVDYNP